MLRRASSRTHARMGSCLLFPLLSSFILYRSRSLLGRAGRNHPTRPAVQCFTPLPLLAVLHVTLTSQLQRSQTRIGPIAAGSPTSGPSPESHPQPPPYLLKHSQTFPAVPKPFISLTGLPQIQMQTSAFPVHQATCPGLALIASTLVAARWAGIGIAPMTRTRQPAQSLMGLTRWL